MRRLIPPLDEAMKALLPLIDKDTRAFDAYLAAVGMPKETADEKKARHDAMQAGLKAAVQVPLEVMRTADRCWEAMVEMAREGNFASRSDLEVGAQGARGRRLGGLAQRRDQPARDRGRGLPARDGRRGRAPRGPRRGDARRGARDARQPQGLTPAGGLGGGVGAPQVDWSVVELTSLVALVGRLRATTRKTEKVALIAELLLQARGREIAHSGALPDGLARAGPHRDRLEKPAGRDAGLDRRWGSRSRSWVSTRLSPGLRMRKGPARPSVGRAGCVLSSSAPTTRAAASCSSC